ncbi:MAG: hypothetical protein IAI49_07775, partial [Candidatus Eremiobacteraeota bacterium]|nr:hypothetical protein [Candidatus Eremiobacteraeota bacterium]
MIAVLSFGRCENVGGRSVRRPVFVPRSTLPLSAACIVANGVREQLSRLLAVEVDVELIEPVVPGPAERRTLVAGATVLRVRGRLCDGFVIVRPADARRLVALAFGENERSERDALSEIERATLERIVAGLVPLCNSLCGTLGPVVRETSERVACDLATYFEVRTTGALRIAVGFGLSRDPAEDVGESLCLDDIAAIELEARVDVAAGALGVPAFSRIAIGTTLRLDTPLGAPGILRFADVPFARVTCGVANGRNAA